MTAVPERLRRNMARVEFLACMDSIEELLAQGFSKRLAYERLREQGRISMAYITFCLLTRKAAQNALPVLSLRPAATLESKKQTSHQSEPKVIKAKQGGLQDPRTIDPQSIF